MANTGKKYSAVIFDLFGTLVPCLSRRDSEEGLMTMAGMLGLDGEEFIRHWGLAREDRDLGILSGHMATILRICERVQFAPQNGAVEKAAQFRLEAVRRWMIPRPDAVPTLTALRAKGLKIGLISDCGAEVVKVWPSMPLAPLVDQAIFSCSVGIKKPDPRIYQIACDRLGVALQLCLYIGDGGSRELTGAERVGMRALMIRPSDEDGPDAGRFDCDGWEGKRIESLSQVTTLVSEAASQ